MKKTILYIIDSLAGIGGAEIMMVAPLKQIHQQYNVIVVTLHPVTINVFEENYFLGDKQLCLHMRSRADILSVSGKLRKIIKENNVDLVHSFLYWSVVVARLACGNKVPHIFSLTTMMKEHVYNHKWQSRYTQLIDQITYKKNQVVIAPTNEVLIDFDKAIGIKGKSQVLYNFVSDDFFKNQIEYKPFTTKLKLAAVGNLKQVKNYQLLIDAFKLIKSYPVFLDIYGDGLLKDGFQKQINDNSLPINLKGSYNKVYEVLPNYDAFVMSSFHEGFGISAAEAMAIGLPVLLSDIKVFKEVSQNNALFFDPYSPQSLADIIIKVINEKMDLKKLSENGKKIAKENYTKQRYLNSLLTLYNETLNKNIF
jgi:glycosyltransferase involved in cell wall biosynthesis